MMSYTKYSALKISIQDYGYFIESKLYLSAGEKYAGIWAVTDMTSITKVMKLISYLFFGLATLIENQSIKVHM